METRYSSIKIETKQAEAIAKERYGIEGTAVFMPGELDFNFKIQTENEAYLLKVGRPELEMDYVEFQTALLRHAEAGLGKASPKTFTDVDGNHISKITDEHGEERIVRLLSWIDGRLWSSVNPISGRLLTNLGKKAGELTKTLDSFDHPYAGRYLEWDIANALWCKDKLELFEGEEKRILTEFLERFEKIQGPYQLLRKSVVHSDVNDNNIVVSEDLANPTVQSIIDFGDAVRTQTINDVAIALAYAMMHQHDPLEAATAFVKGYSSAIQLREDELEMLHTLTAMRLTITVTKAAMNKIAEPENEYHQVSAQPAWEVLKKWIKIDQSWATCHFRNACGYLAHPNFEMFKKSMQNVSVDLGELFPTLEIGSVHNIDLSVGSDWLGHEFEYENLDLFAFKVEELKKENPGAIITGGYHEVRPFYSTAAYRSEGNNGPEYRTMHLGTDFWVNAGTAVHAIQKGEVVYVHNNNAKKDYGPTVIIKHEHFYSLYGHLSVGSLSMLLVGDTVEKGDRIGYVGAANENGEWPPHLHFQLMLDLFNYSNDFPGVGLTRHADLWKEICPDPSWIFRELESYEVVDRRKEIISYRKEHLGKSLSLSYSEPLNMLRGAGVHLIDHTGRRYLDTVNNVAHVGHEHPRVVKAGINQMKLLNTNTRYLHENINEFAQELLETFPEELSVVHFVNSGSEANELALRMAKTVTGQKDMIAVEIGYHGNTGGCIDISSYKFDGKGGKGAPEHTHIVPLPDRFRGIYDQENAEKYAEHVKEQLEVIQAKERNVAGFICESIISCGGQIELPKNYLKTAYAYVRNAGGVCISDEVQVGVGRVGSHFWGFELHDVVPDIVTIGKPLGNGHPLAAVVCTQRVADEFANGMEYFNTFGGNPVSCAIGREVLRVVKDESLQQNALEIGEYLKDGLRQLQMEHSAIQDIRGQGLFLGFEFVDGAKNPMAEKASYLANRMKDFGILMSTDGKDHNAIKIKPPIVFSRENADELLNRLSQVLNEDFMKA